MYEEKGEATSDTEKRQITYRIIVKYSYLINYISNSHQPYIYI